MMIEKMLNNAFGIVKTLITLSFSMVCGVLLAETAPVPDLKDVAYGSASGQVVDVYLAKSDTPTPVAVYIHGGGSKSGTKTLRGSQAVMAPQLLEKGISVVSVGYRLDSTLPTPVHDAARALQFIRFNAGKWNMDKTRIAAWGGSAGGATVLWQFVSHSSTLR
jgi:acetyl esterase/lipase